MLIEFAMLAAAASQPMCSPAQFQEALGSLLSGESRIVAESIRDDYMSQAAGLPAGALDGSRRSLLLFIEFTDSLRVLEDAPAWEAAVIDLHRRVLLASREANNPWIAAPWPDAVALVDAIGDGLDRLEDRAVAARRLDRFLEREVLSDLEDRWALRAAVDSGDAEACRVLTHRAMDRWIRFRGIADATWTKVAASMESFEGRGFIAMTREAMFPGFVDAGPVRMWHWIDANLDDRDLAGDASTLVRRLLDGLATEQEQMIRTIVSTRMEQGIDPWSAVCDLPDHAGQSVRVRNQVLASSSLAHRRTRSAVDAIESLLTDDQRVAMRSALGQYP